MQGLFLQSQDIRSKQLGINESIQIPASPRNVFNFHVLNYIWVLFILGLLIGWNIVNFILFLFTSNLLQFQKKVCSSKKVFTVFLKHGFDRAVKQTFVSSAYMINFVMLVKATISFLYIKNNKAPKRNQRNSKFDLWFVQGVVFNIYIMNLDY